MLRFQLIIGMLLLIAIGILSMSCASTQEPEVSNRWIWVEKQCDEFQDNKNISDSIEINNGDTLVVVLCSNPTTGFMLIVPREEVRHTDLTIEAAFQMIVSAGVAVPLSLRMPEVGGPEQDPVPARLVAAAVTARQAAETPEVGPAAPPAG